jgi:hypothetical protein
MKETGKASILAVGIYDDSRLKKTDRQIKSLKDLLLIFS